jgi:hypothetical protein
MINFEELKIKDSELLDKEQWNGMLDDTRRYFEGNVGLGVDAPEAKLHIEGKGGQSVDLLVNGRIRSNNDHGGLWISNDRFVGGTATNKIGFYNKGWRLLVQNNGNVGIGTDSPSAKLHVNGPLTCGDLKAGIAQVDRLKTFIGEFVTITAAGADISGNLKANRLDCSGVRTTTLHATSLRNIGDKKNVQYNPSNGEVGYDNSTRRDKRNITSLEDDFGKIMQLQPRKYTRPNEPENWEIGYIAEEAKSLGLEHLLFYDQENKPDGINYRKLCLYLVEILREHERKLNPNSPYLEKYIENEIS